VPFVEVFFPTLDPLPDGVEQTMPHNSPFRGVFMSAKGGRNGKYIQREMRKEKREIETLPSPRLSLLRLKIFDKKKSFFLIERHSAREGRSRTQGRDMEV
jgi:hypothetical protein